MHKSVYLGLIIGGCFLFGILIVLVLENSKPACNFDEQLPIVFKGTFVCNENCSSNQEVCTYCCKEINSGRIEQIIITKGRNDYGR